MNARVRLEASYPHSVDRVWRALTDPALIERWIEMSTDFQPILGRPFRFWCEVPPDMTDWGGVVECKVLDIEAPRRMVWSWKDSWSWTRFPAPTRVEWTLAPERAGTLLVLEHTRFDGPGGERLASMLRGGWRGMLARTLPTLLAGAEASAEVSDRSDDRPMAHPGVVPGELREQGEAP